MDTNELQFHCPHCNQCMGIADVGLGDDYSLVFGLYCFQCKDTFNFAYTLSYFQEQFNLAYQKRVPLRPPLLLPAAELHFIGQDADFLTAMRIVAD